MNSEMVKIEELSRYFVDGDGNKLSVLHDLQLTITESTYYAILGKSGSGKSTLLHLLGGLDQPNSGQIFYKNKKLSDYSKNEISEWRNLNLGFVFQFHHLLIDFNALENVMIPQIIAGYSHKEAQEKAQYLLTELGLEERIFHKIPHLSGGEKQRVAIARALINEPKLILADEPTGNLDTGTSEQVATLLLKMCGLYKASLVVATHSETFANQLENIYNLEQGKLERVS